jgi:flagellar M-ring protein FliF
LALLLVMVVVRPLTRQIVATLGQPLPPTTLSTGLGGTSAGGTAGGLATGVGAGRAFGTSEGRAPGIFGSARTDRDGRVAEAQGIYEGVSDYIRREPVQSTRLLESWIGAPVEERD